LKKIKNEKRYIPSLLLTEIKKSDYARKDDLYVIMDIVYRKQNSLKTNVEKFHNYVEIPRVTFDLIITNKRYVTSALEFLIENGWLERLNFYDFENKKSKKFRIPSNWLGDMKEVEVNDKTINNRIKISKMEMRKNRVKNLEPTKKQYYKNFKIDEEKAIKATQNNALEQLRNLAYELELKVDDMALVDVILCTGEFVKTRMKFTYHPSKKGLAIHNIIHRMMHHQQRIYSISQGFLFFKRNSTNGRLDSNLTTLPSYLRKFITSDEKLFNIDIKNSQPYFLYTVLKEETVVDREEVERYGKLVIAGKLYESLIPVFQKIGVIKEHFSQEQKRNTAKLTLFKIFYSKVTSYQKIKDAFGQEFPHILKYINEVNAESNSVLAVKLQTRESDTVLDVIAVELQGKGIKPLTIHDSLVCLESDMLTTMNVIVSNCERLYGIAPALKIETLLDETFQDDGNDFEDENYDYGDGFESLFVA